MTDRELMQQALDLLDDINQCSLPPTGIPLPAEIDHVMEALRARLAQPEQEHIKHWSDCAVHNAPAYPSGKCDCGGFPVAWFDPKGVQLEFDIEDCFSFQKKEGYQPLYTAPPQREWQTLTENEIKHLWYEACQTNLELTSQLIVHLARNIEAKLKEKNNA